MDQRSAVRLGSAVGFVSCAGAGEAFDGEGDWPFAAAEALFGSGAPGPMLGIAGRGCFWAKRWAFSFHHARAASSSSGISSPQCFFHHFGEDFARLACGRKERRISDIHSWKIRCFQTWADNPNGGIARNACCKKEFPNEIHFGPDLVGLESLFDLAGHLPHFTRDDPFEIEIAHQDVLNQGQHGCVIFWIESYCFIVCEIVLIFLFITGPPVSLQFFGRFCSARPQLS